MIFTETQKSANNISNFMPVSKRALARIPKVYRNLTSSIRLMPNFIVIGAQKCGTTSLFEYLIEHPSISAPARKEIAFFSRHFSKGINCYRSYFPTLFHRLGRQGHITGEASTGYICHPHAPRRIAETIPQVKLIALLRNPVDRAYSHYHHTVRRGRENLSFEEAIEKEDERLHGLVERMLENENYYNKNFHYYSYLSRGIYVEQLKIWLEAFRRDQILILRSESLDTQPSATLEKVLNFLDVPCWEPKKYERYNSNSYIKRIDPATRQYLIDYFKPHNEKLYKLLGVNFDWDK